MKKIISFVTAIFIMFLLAGCKIDTTVEVQNDGSYKTTLTYIMKQDEIGTETAREQLKELRSNFIQSLEEERIKYKNIDTDSEFGISFEKTFANYEEFLNEENWAIFNFAPVFSKKTVPGIIHKADDNKVYSFKGELSAGSSRNYSSVATTNAFGPDTTMTLTVKLPNKAKVNNAKEADDKNHVYKWEFSEKSPVNMELEYKLGGFNLKTLIIVCAILLLLAILFEIYLILKAKNAKNGEDLANKEIETEEIVSEETQETEIEEIASEETQETETEETTKEVSEEMPAEEIIDNEITETDEEDNQ